MSSIEVGHLIGSCEISYLYKSKQLKEPAMSFILFISTKLRSIHNHFKQVVEITFCTYRLMITDLDL